MDAYGIFVQLIGFVGAMFFFLSYQAKSNKSLFIIQTLGCLSFCIQFALLGAYSGCLSIFVNIIRNLMLTRYNDYKWIRWKGCAIIICCISAAVATTTWAGYISLLPVAGTMAGTLGSWTNNAKHIRMANLFINAPCMLLYDLLVSSWGGVLNESVTIISIILSIIRFGWRALDGDKIG